MGRPTRTESDRRRHEFLRLIAAGKSGDIAAEQARIKPERALAILTHPHGREALLAAKAA
jgi:hypothetical protein